MVRDEAGDTSAALEGYRAATGDTRTLPAFAFGDAPAMAQELGELVRRGRKRATAALVADLEHDGDPLPVAGDRSVVLDGRSVGCCVIETVDVRVGPVSSVDAAFAWDEGEGDRTREDWLAVHEAFFRRRCAALGLDYTDDLPTVFERFTVVWPPPASPGPLARRGATLARVTGFAEHPGGLPGLLAVRGDTTVGRAAFRPRPGGWAELATLDAADGDAAGVLVDAADALARREGWTLICHRPAPA